ncbi:LANO_0E04720g1_1 [Lachancea nothofagi CBS 11611]|uniref:LANO_0E04720g1_1 n=1 Tax=Lachancea nothofagi CBS 11611 TaxID=1266666 RepID=A0A1G4JSQ9_9SACH|nr:LANO_0E04720g1_1 [Lachancea nothofagi CBS 11611]
MSSSKLDNSIELEELLGAEHEQGSNISEQNNRWVEYNGEIVKLYSLNYQKEPIVRWQMAASLTLFLVLGLNDECNGALLPTLSQHYNVSKVKLANLFIVQFVGYGTASLLTQKIHTLVGARGAMVTAAGLCVLCYTILLLRPPWFAVYVACFMPLGLAIGILDSVCNVLFGNLEVHKNEWMGVLHGLYGAAAMVTAPVVSYFVKFGHWNHFFLLPLVCAFVGLAMVSYAFKDETANKYNYLCEASRVEGDDTHPTFWSLLRRPAIFMYAIYMFIYLGSEVSTGAWIFTYLLDVKKGEVIPMSYVTAAFWMGLTVGRLVLGFVTKRCFKNEYRASLFYANICLAFYTAFLFVTYLSGSSAIYFVAVAVTIFFGGVFIGPLFPNASVVALQVLPKNMHVSGVGIAVALGGCGSAILPYSVGLISNRIGFAWFPFLCWIMVAIVNIVWFMYPRVIKGHSEYL